MRFFFSVVLAVWLHRFSYPANFQQSSNKHSAGLMEPRRLSAVG